MDTGCNRERREFLRALTLSTVALTVGGCSSPVGVTQTQKAPAAPNPPGNPPPNPPPTNQAPVWQTVPTITFTQGVQGSISIAGFVSDPNGDSLAINMTAGTLPAGVTFDAVNKRFVYDGIGTIASSSGIVLTANDGKIP